ncbi:sulfotransferase family 2 domain-containing protein [Vreelandella janggokensis]|uniref:sulfotransferase family 2 domain-containing protein n=1 Tax=Vreelandella janggokensis TaxID=370767 RepID=UPI002866E950|nr:sulfotransferase family 2 domain-containing protein [Halomonas janggokensis]MDR5886699.1 sulfotransferase family 2 domain-containing protein [Halomonas janggokensis]
MIKKKHSTLLMRAKDFCFAICRQPKLIRLYFGSGVKARYSLRDIKCYGVLFLHIPKCAGVSVNKSLYGSLGAGHITLHNAFIGLGPFDYTNVFKFTVVRNPWDRLVSAYFFLKSGGFGQKDQDFFIENISGYYDFNDFVMNWVTKENVDVWNHFRPQSSFLSIVHNEVDLDFICFFESLAEDFSYIYNAKRWESFNTLANINSSDHKDYRQYYTDASKKIVEEVYEDDIRLFGYDFDGKTSEHQRSWRNAEFPL